MPAASTSRSITLQVLDEHKIDELTEDLLSLASELGLSLDTSCARLCVQHLLYVQQVNEYMNLTRITDLHEALVLHIVDSLALLKYIPDMSNRFLDMGTGAGFPGIPFGIVSGSSGVLLDSVGKKVNAVNAFIDRLELTELIGVHARLEEYAQNEAGAFDLVMARAVGSLPLLIEYGTPFLKRDGYLLLAKANPIEDELDAGLHAAHVCGLSFIEAHEFDLPRDLGHRTVLLYQCIGKPTVKLPRPVGTAKKTPLA